MTELLMSDRKKMGILKVLIDGKPHTYHNLAKSLKTNYWTVRKNCKFLEILNLIEVVRVGKGKGVPQTAHRKVKITDKGAEFIGKY